METNVERISNLQDIKKAELDRETGLFLYEDMTLGRRVEDKCADCLLYTSDAADDSLRVDLGGRRIIKKNHENRPSQLRMLTNQNFVKVFSWKHT